MEKTQDVQVPAQSSAVYFTLDQKELLANADPKKTFLVFDLAVGGENVSWNLIFFNTMHNLNLPRFGVISEVNGATLKTSFLNSPRIATSLEGSNGTYAITLRSPVIARRVYISFGDLDVRTADNYFDLLPGEPVTVKLKAPFSVSLDQLKSSLQVISLTDAFPASATKHLRAAEFSVRQILFIVGRGCTRRRKGETAAKYDVLTRTSHENLEFTWIGPPLLRVCIVVGKSAATQSYRRGFCLARFQFDSRETF
jgi:hypothetical protein